MGDGLRVRTIGHVVLRVRDLGASLAFYRDLLGMTEVARYRGAMVFLSFGTGNHHDLALQQIGADAADADANAVGLYHIAFKVGDTLDELRAWVAKLQAAGVTILGASDHRVSQALYIADPDGIEIELFVDADPAIWRDDPAAVANIMPLRL